MTIDICSHWQLWRRQCESTDTQSKGNDVEQKKNGNQWQSLFEKKRFETIVGVKSEKRNAKSQMQDVRDKKQKNLEEKTIGLFVLPSRIRL